jgi:cyclohexanecarboxylate-CoA ligase
METNLTDTRIRAMTGAGFWRNESLETYLDRWARERPAKTALVDGQGRYTWEALARAVDRVAHGLRAHGVEQGSVISCQLPNWNETILIFLAALRLGAVVNPIPPTYRASELRFMLGLLESQVAVVPAAFRGFGHAGMLASLRPALPRLEHVFVARGEGPEGTMPLTTLTDQAWEARAGRRGLPGTDANAVEVVFTSGTTGEPKGVMHTQNTTLSTIYRAIERLEFSDPEVVLMASTLGHQTGYLFGYCLTLLLGATAVWLDVWSAEEGARLIEAEGVTFTMGATPFLRDLTYTEAARDLRSLRLFISAGAPVPRQLVRDARARLGCAISAGWGMTENGLATCNGLRDAEERRYSVATGPLCPAWSCRWSMVTALPSQPVTRATCSCAARPSSSVTSSGRSSPRTRTPPTAGSRRATGARSMPPPTSPSPGGRRTSSSAGARTSRSWRSRTCSTLIRRSPGSRSWPYPTPGWGSAPARL